MGRPGRPQGARDAVPVPILHCYADYKWTGPSEPVLQMCLELSRRGWPSDLACMAAPPGRRNELSERAAAAGLTIAEAFAAPGRWAPAQFLTDRKRVGDLLRTGRYGIVHCHGSWDHAVVGALRRAAGRAGVRVVRTDHRARDYAGNPLWRYYFGPGLTDHLIVLSDRHAVQAVTRLRRLPEDVTVVRGAVDVAAFRPIEVAPSTRERFGLAAGDVIVGLIARVQRHRRFDVLLRAAELVRAKDQRIKIAVCGRGTHRAELLDRPLAKMGLQETVIPLGYRRDDYTRTIAMFDAGLMLVPGSDGSCRAALQMAAMGKPLIVSRRGVLPDIVRDGETGIVVEDTPENLADALAEMAADAERRRRWGLAARERMCRFFSLEREAAEVIAVYSRLTRSP